MELQWQLNDRRGTQIIIPGENHVLAPVYDGEVITCARAVLDIPVPQKIFLNGFQTWTHCQEYQPCDRIRGLRGIPKLAAGLLGIDHFGDYHFIPYSNRRGIFHGFSYCYFRDGETYRLLASLNEEPGYTVFTYDANRGALQIERDCQGVCAAGSSFPVFDLFYAEGSEQEVFDGWFDALKIRNAPPALKGYSSWYNRYRNINENSIRKDLAGAERIFEWGDLFQIDDGWEKHVGDWLGTDLKKFPNGLRSIAADIHHAGFKAGLWLAPFVCERNSKIYKEHPDWLLQYQGKPWKSGPNWGGFYALDIDHPEVIDYLERVFHRVFSEWEFDLVKLDFLYAAAPFATGDHGNPGDKPFTESRASRMIRAMKFLRRVCNGKLILGCGVPVMPAFGLVDYCRVGCDVSLDWDDFPLMRLMHRERISTKNSLDNTIFRRELNGRAFGNDPDVFFLRNRNLSLRRKEKDYLAAVNALLGSMWLTSDDLNSYDDAKIARYKELARLREAEHIRIDPDTHSISYLLDGKEHRISHPHLS